MKAKNSSTLHRCSELTKWPIDEVCHQMAPLRARVLVNRFPSVFAVDAPTEANIRSNSPCKPCQGPVICVQLSATEALTVPSGIIQARAMIPPERSALFHRKPRLSDRL